MDDRVKRLLDDLTADQRSVVALRIVAGFTLEETARIMDRSVGSIKQLQRRALGGASWSAGQGGVTK